MPTFDYECAACGREFEEFVRHRDDPVKCPGCAGSDVTRLVSAPNTTFRYGDDHAFKGKKRHGDGPRLSSIK